jgi:hypothetical protein
MISTENHSPQGEDEEQDNSRHFSFLSGRLTERTVLAWPTVQDLCRKGLHDPTQSGAARVVVEYYGEDLLVLLAGIFRYYFRAKAWRTLELAGSYTATAIKAIVEALHAANLPAQYLEHLTIRVPSFAHDTRCLENLARLIRYTRHVVLECPHFFIANMGILDWEFFWNALESHLKSQRPTIDLVVSLQRTPNIDYFDHLCKFFSLTHPKKSLVSEFRVLDTRSEVRFEFLPEILLHLAVGSSFSWVFQNSEAQIPKPHRMVLDQSRKALQENNSVKRLEFCGLTLPGFAPLFEKIYLDGLVNRPPSLRGVETTIEHISVTGVELSEVLIRRLPTKHGVKSVTCTWFPRAKEVLAEALGLKDKEATIQTPVDPVAVQFHNDFSVSVAQRATDRQEIAQLFRLKNLLVKAQQMDTNTDPKNVYNLLVHLHTYNFEEYPAIAPPLQKLLKVQVEIWCEEGWEFHDILDKTARLKQEAQTRLVERERRALVPKQKRAPTTIRQRSGRGISLSGRGRGRSGRGSGQGRGSGHRVSSRNSSSSSKSLERSTAESRHSAGTSVYRGHSQNKRISDRRLQGPVRARQLRHRKTDQRTHVEEEIARTRLLKEKFALFKEMKESLTEEEIVAIEPGLIRFCKIGTNAPPSTTSSLAARRPSEVAAAVLPIIHNPEPKIIPAASSETDQKTVRVIRRTIVRTRPSSDNKKAVRPAEKVDPPDDDATIVSSNVKNEPDIQVHEDDTKDISQREQPDETAEDLGSDYAVNKDGADSDTFDADFDTKEEQIHTEDEQIHTEDEQFHTEDENDEEADWFAPQGDEIVEGTPKKPSFLDDSSDSEDSSSVGRNDAGAFENDELIPMEDREEEKEEQNSLDPRENDDQRGNNALDHDEVVSVACADYDDKQPSEREENNGESLESHSSLQAQDSSGSSHINHEHDTKDNLTDFQNGSDEDERSNQQSFEGTEDHSGHVSESIISTQMERAEDSSHSETSSKENNIETDIVEGSYPVDSGYEDPFPVYESDESPAEDDNERSSNSREYEDRYVDDNSAVSFQDSVADDRRNSQSLGEDESEVFGEEDHQHSEHSSDFYEEYVEDHSNSGEFSEAYVKTDEYHSEEFSEDHVEAYQQHSDEFTEEDMEESSSGQHDGMQEDVDITETSSQGNYGENEAARATDPQGEMFWFDTQFNEKDSNGPDNGEQEASGSAFGSSGSSFLDFDESSKFEPVPM